MFNNNRKFFRKTAYTGEFGTETGSVEFAEDYFGDGFYVEVWNSGAFDNKKIYLSASDVLAIAQMGLITECFTTEKLLEDTLDVVKQNQKREQSSKQPKTDQSSMRFTPRMPFDLEDAYDATHADLPGGDGTLDYYAVEGWGTIDLTSTDQYRGC